MRSLKASAGRTAFIIGSSAGVRFGPDEVRSLPLWQKRVGRDAKGVKEV